MTFRIWLGMLTLWAIANVVCSTLVGNWILTTEGANSINNQLVPQSIGVTEIWNTIQRLFLFNYSILIYTQLGQAIRAVLGLISVAFVVVSIIELLPKKSIF
jgi:hypothetical protein